MQKEKLFIVYFIEENSKDNIVGVFNDEILANNAKLIHFNSEIKEVYINEIGIGYTNYLKAIGIDFQKLLDQKNNGLKPLTDLDKDCLMTVEEFNDSEDSGLITIDDGDGYYATSDMVSDISCFNDKPDWATHVCWYNK